MAPGKAMPAGQAPASPGAVIPAGPPTLSSLIPPYQPFVVLRKRPVLFATNRTYRSDTGTPTQRFGNAVDARVRYGSCLVNLPIEKNHIQGQLEQPHWLSGDPDLYFAIDVTKLLGFNQFRDGISHRGGDTRRDILVYVHGFNTPFDFAVMRLAQVSHDIQFSGEAVAFSWPSHGSDFEYQDDETNATLSVNALTETLRTLAEIQAARTDGARGKIHVIAHSLGNRVTLRALKALHEQLANGQKPFGHVILAAPDVSISEFTKLVPAAQARADRVTLYFCPDDKALSASWFVHLGERRAGSGIVPITALDNIDARKANTSILGHGYWAEVKQLLIDLQMLVNFGWSPAERIFTLEPMIAPPDYRYWAFR